MVNRINIFVRYITDHRSTIVCMHQRYKNIFVRVTVSVRHRTRTDDVKSMRGIAFRAADFASNPLNHQRYVKDFSGLGIRSSVFRSNRLFLWSKDHVDLFFFTVDIFQRSTRANRSRRAIRSFGLKREKTVKNIRKILFSFDRIDRFLWSKDRFDLEKYQINLFQRSKR